MNIASRFTISAAAAVLALAVETPVAAHDYTVGALDISHPVARAVTPYARASAGFLTIANTGETDDRLIAVDADFAARIELHTHTMNDGIMRMREVEGGIVVPAGETTTLQPGGLHVMFMGLTEQLVEGESRPATLVFEHAGAMDIMFSVEAIRRGGAHHGE